MGIKIKKNLLPSSKYGIKCPYTMNPSGICIHNTANDASAENEIAYMIRNDNETSFHFAVDNIQAVQGVPLNRNAWHAGDGRIGTGNRKYIAIEICYSKSGGDKFTASEKNAVHLIVKLLKEYGWTTKNIKRHYDFSGKNCPHRTMALGWQRFLDMVAAELNPVDNWYEKVNKIGTTKIQARIDTYLYEVDTNKQVKAYNKGDIITVVYSLGDWYFTAYSVSKKIKNGFKIAHWDKYIEPVEEPTEDTPEETEDTPSDTPPTPSEPTEETGNESEDTSSNGTETASDDTEEESTVEKKTLLGSLISLISKIISAILKK